MKRKIFGTIRQIICDSALKVKSISIVPTCAYAIKGTVDEKKTFALLRPDNDSGDIVSVEYRNSLNVEFLYAIQFPSPVMTGVTIGMILDDTASNKVKIAGIDHGLQEIVFA